MTHLTVSGKTVDEAVAKAVNELQTTRERLTYEVIQQPKNGFLGIFGSRPATIEAYVLPDPVEKAYTFLEETVTLMGFNPTITKENKEHHTLLDLSDEKEIGRLIGRRGQTLESLQYLTNLAANRHEGSYRRIVLDAENYRGRRQKTLEQLALRVANKAIRTKQPVPLEPMDSLERKIIHTALQSVEGVDTFSRGRGIKRHIVITPYDSSSKDNE